MKHHKTERKLGRTSGQRKALLASLARSLVLEEKIKTTEAKAKELRPFIEKMVTNGRKGTLASRRQAVSVLGDEAGKKIVTDISERFKDRNGGYTRITKLPLRKSDSAKMAVIEFV